MNTSNTVCLRARQDGAILVTSLLLLLVLTILGIAMMKMTSMQDRMAGNTRDVNLAFQGAEAAIRVGEAQVRTLIAPGGIPPTQPTIDCTICDPGVLPVELDDPVVFNWDTNGFSTTGIGTVSGARLDEEPQYKIEHTQFVSDPISQGVNGDELGRDVFTVTARSTGASGRTNTVIQSTYARRF